MMNATRGLQVFIVISVFLFFPLLGVNAVTEPEAQNFLNLINEYRAQNGAGPLTLDRKLQNAADWMSQDMLDHCVLNGTMCSHTDSLGRTFSSRLYYFGYTSQVGGARGENLAWGSGLSLASDAFRGWKASPGHNANMLNSTYAAIGISVSCQNSKCAWVTDFGGKVSEPFELSPAPAPISDIPPSVPETPPQVSDEMQTNLADGDLIRQKGGIDVYIVKLISTKKFKRIILNSAVFNNYQHLKWENVREVDGAILDSFATSDLVRAAGDQKVYRLYPNQDSGEKRWITTPEVFARLGFDYDAVYEINQFDKDSYSTGFPLE